MSDQCQMKLAKRMLDCSAQTWANQCADKFVTFEVFEKLFLNKYWGEAKQAKIQNEFLNGPNYVKGKQHEGIFSGGT